MKTKTYDYAKRTIIKALENDEFPTVRVNPHTGNIITDEFDFDNYGLFINIYGNYSQQTKDFEGGSDDMGRVEIVTDFVSSSLELINVEVWCTETDEDIIDTEDKRLQIIKILENGLRTDY